MKASPDKKNNDDDNDGYIDNYEFLGQASLMESHNNYNQEDDDHIMKSYLVPAENKQSADDNEDQLQAECNRVKFQVE